MLHYVHMDWVIHVFLHDLAVGSAILLCLGEGSLRRM
jgi:hypothetical protein